MEPAIYAFIGTLVGAISSIATTWISQAKSASLELKKSDIENRERQNAFQRETLLTLQESLHDSIRKLSELHLLDRQSYASGIAFRKAEPSTELGEHHRLSLKKVMLSIERVTNEELRARVKEYTALSTHVLLCKTMEDSEVKFLNLLEQWPQLNELIGVNLRKHL